MRSCSSSQPRGLTDVSGSMGNALGASGSRFGIADFGLFDGLSAQKPALATVTTRSQAERRMRELHRKWASGLNRADVQAGSERMRSEYQTSAQLDNARVVSGCRPAELAVVQVGVHALEIHPVQDIEELKAKLQVYSLGDPVVLNHAPVDV